MGTTNQTISFNYNFVDIKLLQWKAGEEKADAAMIWRPRFEIAFDHHSRSYPLVYVDAAVFLGISDNEFSAMIKVRSVFSITKFENDAYPQAAIAWLMEFALSHCRAIAVCKCNEENLNLPPIPYFKFERLQELASLALYKSSVTALSHGGDYPENEGSLAKGVNRLKVHILWFTVPEKSNVISLQGEEENGKASISFNYDYQKINEQQWKVYLDWGISIAGTAKIKVRSGFAPAYTEDELFNETNLVPLLEEAYNNCMHAFSKQCSMHGINREGAIDPGKDHFEDIGKSIIKQYFQSRKKDDERNTGLHAAGFSLTVGDNTRLVVKATFMILDEILFLNPAFNHRHNQQMLADSMVHEPLYYTVKYNCLEIENGAIKLNILHTVMFCICLDVALQLLLDHHADDLQPVFAKYNFTPLRQQEFIKFGSHIYKMFSDKKDEGFRITNLEEHKDWTSMIK
ncbi:MAG: hypothetical protein ABI723_06250 [Bacteroidia bacterium]